MNALSPAKVQRVIDRLRRPDRVMEVVVEDKQLSLAIGKKGQNVRLAAKLTGWKIDIKSEEEKRKEVEAELGALEAPAGEAGEEAAGGEDAVAAEPGADAAVDAAAAEPDAEDAAARTQRRPSPTQTQRLPTPADRDAQ